MVYTLRDKCASLVLDGQGDKYEYELCIFGSATQKPASGSGSTVTLGSWSKWTKPSAEPEQPGGSGSSGERW